MKSKETELLYLYLFFDLILLNVSIAMGIFIWGIDHEWYYYLHGNVAWIITYILFPKRNLYLQDGFSNRLIRISRRTLFFIVISLLLAFTTYRFNFSLRFFFGYTFLLWVQKSLFYFFLYRYLLYLRNMGLHVKRCVIVDYSRMGERLRKILEYNPILGYSFLGYIGNDDNTIENQIGKTDDFESLIQEHQIDMVFILNNHGTDDDCNKYKKLIQSCHQYGVRIRFVPQMLNWNRLGTNSETLMGIPLIDPIKIPLDSLWKRFWKRMFDVAFSLAIIILIFSWLFPLLAILVKLSSKGPVFFAQKRTGLDNHTFTCYKFRSMRMNGQSDKQQATANDKRITTIGKIMRKTNMDELPQFFNVLFGNMSVVGPRPHMLAHTDLYSGLIDKYLMRHYVKPGITGWAQVNGFRGETDELWKMEKRVYYDMEYIRTWSVWLDLRIIFLTVFGKKTYDNAF
jgi:putative colanic acid biosysnthesis UDP-glucose lipid carrier transferase